MFGKNNTRCNAGRGKCPPRCDHHDRSRVTGIANAVVFLAQTPRKTSPAKCSRTTVDCSATSQPAPPVGRHRHHAIARHPGRRSGRGQSAFPSRSAPQTLKSPVSATHDGPVSPPRIAPTCGVNAMATASPRTMVDRTTRLRPASAWQCMASAAQMPRSVSPGVVSDRGCRR